MGDTVAETVAGYLAAVRFLKADEQIVRDSATLGHGLALAACPLADGLGVRLAVGVATSRGRAARLAAGTARVAHVLRKGFPQPAGVLGRQVDQEIHAVEGKGHGFVGLPTVEIVNQLDNGLLRHDVLRVLSFALRAEYRAGDDTLGRRSGVATSQFTR